MKKLFSTFALLGFLALSTQGAFAWTYTGLGSLNPFTNFGRGDTDCGCKKVERCANVKTSNCNTHYYKVIKQEPCGCAAPIEVYNYDTTPIPKCTSCQRKF